MNFQVVRKITLVAIVAFYSGVGLATNSDIYVSPIGVDDKSRSGEKAQPYKTVAFALKKAVKGSRIILRAGRYQEEVTTDNIKGTKDEPIVITAYPNEKVLFDGTDVLHLNWQPYQNGIYRGKVAQDVWQLFINNEQMMPARWPNARFDTGSIYSQQGWSKALIKPSSNGYLVDDPSKHDLAASGLNIEGSLVIANTGSYTTWTRKVTEHEVGRADFKHDKTPSIKNKHFNYYLEGKLEFLDEETEWFYQKDQQFVYFKPKQKLLKNTQVKGKVRAYSFDVRKWQHVVIKNIDFFAAPIQCENCDYVTLENVNFDFAGVSRRMLGEAGTPANMVRLSSGKKGKGHFIVRNCRISDTDSQAIVVHGNYSLVENCHFENTDYAVTEAHRPGSDIALSGIGVQYRFNTNINSGNSATLALSGPKRIEGKRAYSTLTAEFNDMSKTGFAQTDGSIIQGHIPMQNGVNIRYNWFHDTSKFAMRFDAPIPAVRWGKHGLVHHNVLWNTGGMMIKGTDHRVYNNLAINNEYTDIIVLKDKVTKKQLKKKKIKPGTKIGGGNVRTQTANNVAGSISGHRKKPKPVPGSFGKNINLSEEGLDAQKLLVDLENRDFRPVNMQLVNKAQVIEDKDISLIYSTEQPYSGVYPAQVEHYWIPGKRLIQASHPIPADMSIAKKTNVDLIWREAYRATRHRVYVSHQKKQLADKVPQAKWLVAEKAQSNIYRLNRELNQIYYWRVDAFVDNQWVKGSVWQIMPSNS